jgi:hypothetical protein
MSMPKGFKSKTGYATASATYNGMGYREIAEEMTKQGFKMNHSTARNVFLSSMKKIAKEVCIVHGEEISSHDMYRIVADPRFQSGICEILSEM